MKKIKNYPDYRVDDTGQVYSFRGRKNGYKLKGIKSTQTLKYLQVGLYRPDSSKVEHKYIHRLVWEAYKGPIPKEMTVDHIDGNPGNNHLDNLRLLTQKDNNKIWNVKNRQNGSLRTKRDEMLKLREQGWNREQIANHFSCSVDTVTRVINKKMTGKRGDKYIYADYKLEFDNPELKKEI